MIRYIIVLYLISYSVILITGLTGVGYGIGTSSHGIIGLIGGLGGLSGPGCGLILSGPGPGNILAYCDFNHAIK